MKKLSGAYRRRLELIKRTSGAIKSTMSQMNTLSEKYRSLHDQVDRLRDKRTRMYAAKNDNVYLNPKGSDKLLDRSNQLFNKRFKLSHRITLINDKIDDFNDRLKELEKTAAEQYAKAFKVDPEIKQTIARLKAARKKLYEIHHKYTVNVRHIDHLHDRISGIRTRMV